VVSEDAGRHGSAGETAFLERLRARLPPAPEGQEWIGDDAAVLEGGLLLATDALVEGVHFDLRWCAAADVGWKALAVNLSDLAAPWLFHQIVQDSRRASSTVPRRPRPRSAAHSWAVTRPAVRS